MVFFDREENRTDAFITDSLHYSGPKAAACHNLSHVTGISAEILSNVLKSI